MYGSVPRGPLKYHVHRKEEALWGLDSMRSINCIVVRKRKRRAKKRARVEIDE